jgi:hypothetical protein
MEAPGEDQDVELLEALKQLEASDPAEFDRLRRIILAAAASSPPFCEKVSQPT